jgi:hypothetical protein
MTILTQFSKGLWRWLIYYMNLVHYPLCKICIFHVSGLTFSWLLKGADSSADIMQWNKKLVGWYTWMVSRKWHECKWSCWRCCPFIHLEKLRKKRKKIQSVAWSQFKDLNKSNAMDKAPIDPVVCVWGGGRDMQNTRICYAFFYWIPFCWQKAVLWILVMSFRSNLANKHSGPPAGCLGRYEQVWILSDFTVWLFHGYFRFTSFILCLFFPPPCAMILHTSFCVP